MLTQSRKGAEKRVGFGRCDCPFACFAPLREIFVRQHVIDRYNSWTFLILLPLTSLRSGRILTIQVPQFP